MGLDVVQGVAAQAVIGGTASVVGGGKFENGAVTAAFGYLFNDLLIEKTSSAGGLHQRLVIRDKNGEIEYGISFGMTDNGDPWVRNFSAFSQTPKPGQIGNGMVYLDMDMPSTGTVDFLRTTLVEDSMIINYMWSLTGNTAPYNAFTNSCRNFCATQFDYIRGEVLRSRVRDTLPEFK